jgi:hypothetical protein
MKKRRPHLIPTTLHNQQRSVPADLSTSASRAVSHLPYHCISGLACAIALKRVGYEVMQDRDGDKVHSQFIQHFFYSVLLEHELDLIGTKPHQHLDPWGLEESIVAMSDGLYISICMCTLSSLTFNVLTILRNRNRRLVNGTKKCHEKLHGHNIRHPSYRI